MSWNPMAGDAPAAFYDMLYAEDDDVEGVEIDDDELEGLYCDPEEDGMGSCLCRDKTQVCVPTVHYSTPASSMDSAGSGSAPKRPRIMERQSIDLLLLEVLRYIGTYQGSSQEASPALAEIHQLADTAEGWCHVMQAMVNMVPLYDPLAPSVIIIVYGECPLPSMDTVLSFTRSMQLTKERCAVAYGNDENIRRERNLLVVLGCIAEKLAGPNSVKVMTEDVLLYLVTFLVDESEPNLVLHALITLEKFAQTSESKEAIERLFASKFLNPLLPLEMYDNAKVLLWRQVGFCARWALDNIFLISARKFSFETTNMNQIHAILNFKDVSDYLKISPDGLEARCDAQSFESVRATFQIDASCWYYEAQIITAGVMQIGWATKNAVFQNHEGYGVGDDTFSLAYDGCRRLVWFNAMPTPVREVPIWQPGDILGCLIDVDSQEAIFSLNGRCLPVRTDIFRASRGFYAAASFMVHQQCRFNFGAQPFEYPPRDRQYRTMNTFGNLNDNEKKVIPRRVILKEIHKEDQEDDHCCTICFEDAGNYGVDPCEHGSFCLKCVQKLRVCPLCRCPIREFFILVL